MAAQLYRSTETIQEQGVELAQLRGETQELNQNLNTARRHLRESQNTVLERDKTILEQQEIIESHEELAAINKELDESYQAFICEYARTTEITTEALWDSFWYHGITASDLTELEALNQQLIREFC